ncbi:prephenate dehydrogenase dimerization domain-containing protein [Haliangium ochraceum]|uniref:Prephenate dehydrogenase n=1 Tax=Haliangium ochraceum (strain DSM 14365 / JCM 11303 / SMP-2) TaxID=502025 RepID=D0LUN2_HALO1|nr:prephenate dehydrogenase dimerization domain-containing protein [Haliangium ochraceum]ACY13922.1 Prephenate dehydrogenase [Haliangium ochraceum DSM 14365]
MSADRPAITILGVNGAFGARMARSFTDQHGPLRGVDLAARAAADVTLSEYVAGDLSAPDDAVRAAIGAAEWVLACMPEPVTEACVAELLDMLAPGAMLVAFLSVHGPFFERVRALGAESRVLGLNPLFAPSLDFAGQAVVAINGERVVHASAFLDRLRALGAHVEPMSAAQHDRHMAAVQVATHAAVLAFGHSLAALDYDVSTGLHASTPPHRTLLALLGRMASGSAAVYGEIQCTNPFAQEARAALSQSLAALATSAAQGERAFEDFFADAVRSIAPRRAHLAQQCAALFAAAPRTAAAPGHPAPDHPPAEQSPAETPSADRPKERTSHEP